MSKHLSRLEKAKHFSSECLRDVANSILDNEVSEKDYAEIFIWFEQNDRLEILRSLKVECTDGRCYSTNHDDYDCSDL